MTIKFIPNRSTTLKARELVLIEDVVGRNFPNRGDVIPISLQDKVAVFCSRENFDELRDRYPELPIYGIWQLILASRQHWSDGLYAVYFDDELQSGMFLECQDGEFSSGSIVGGRPLAAVCARDLSRAKIISLGPDDLNFSCEPIMTRIERGRELSHRCRKIAAVLTGSVVASLLSCFGTSQWLEQGRHEYRQAEAAWSGEISALLKKREILQSNRLAEWPNQWDVLQPLVRLNQEKIRFQVWGAQLGSPIEVQLLPASGVEEAPLPVWMESLPQMKTERQFDGSLKLSWQPEQ